MSVRSEWLKAMLTIVSPVMDALARGRLKETLPLDFHGDRARFAPLEAFGRSMLGLSPWLEAEEGSLDAEERDLQKQWREKALICIDRATAPDSPDRMLFDEGGQPLVDAAFLAHALLRAPKAVAGALEPRVRRNLADCLRSSRKIVPVESNWLFFSSMVEAGLYVLGEEWDSTRLLMSLRSFRHWYLGDGIYGDGPAFHWDYYNSFVIQPMAVDLVRTMRGLHPEIDALRDAVLQRASRYASELERMISPEGSYPIIGRSICYRFGAFQMLSQAVLQHMLEPHLSPASVRCGLTAVLRRIMGGSIFDEKGFLVPGITSCQPELAEPYINIGSLYLCSALFLPLGLSPRDPFWADPDAPWTGKTVWDGGHSVIDHALD